MQAANLRPGDKTRFTLASGFRSDAGVCLAIFFLAFALRLAYLFQIKSIPLFYNLVGDPRGYDEWAQRIVAGDWLGHEVFYQAPLYPYFLAVLQAIFGHDLWAIRVVQIVVGAVMCSLLYLAGKRLFSPVAGLVAGVLLALYAPAIFFAAVIDKTALDPFLVVLMLILLGSGGEKIGAAKWLAVGAILGLLGLSRENALVWILVIAPWIWFHLASAPSSVRLRWVGLFVLGLALILVPVGIRNFTVGGQFTLTTSQLGPNFFIGNNPFADGTYDSIRTATGEKQFEQPEATRLAEQATGRTLSPREVSSYWVSRSWDYIRSQPRDWLRLMWKKWLMVWNVREIDDSDDFYLYQKWSRLLTFLASLSNFGLLVPLASLGCLLTWRQWRRLWLLYGMLGSFSFSVALFYVFARYRFLLVPLLVLFAGAGVVEGFALWKKRRWQALPAYAGCLVVLAMSFGFAHWPVAGKPEPSAAAYNNLASAYGEQGKIDEGIASAEQALKLDPAYGTAHYNLAILLVSKGRLAEAEAGFLEAIRLHPHFMNAHRNLGDLLMLRGESGAAAAHYREALKLDPNQSDVHFTLGGILASQGRLDEAAEHFREAVKIEPAFAEAHESLGGILAHQGALEPAVEQFRRALQINPDLAQAHETLAALLVKQGKKEEAERHYREAVRIMKARRDTAAR